jgi:hypothetical protein
VNAPAQLSLKLINPHAYPSSDNHPNAPNSSSFTDTAMRSNVNAFANYRPNPYLHYPELPVTGYNDLSPYNNSNSNSNSNSSGSSSQAPTPQARTINPYANPGTPANVNVNVNVSSLNVNPSDKRTGTPMAAYPAWHQWHHGPPLPEPLPYSNVYYPVNPNLPDSQNIVNSVSVATATTPSYYQTHQQVQSLHNSQSQSPVSQQQQIPQYHQQEPLYYPVSQPTTEMKNFENILSTNNNNNSNKHIISSSTLLTSNASSSSLTSFLPVSASTATSSSTSVGKVVKNPVYVDPYCDLLDGFDNFPVETMMIREEKLASVRCVMLDKAVNTDITQATLFPTL